MQNVVVIPNDASVQAKSFAICVMAGIQSGLKKNWVLKKSPTQWVLLGFLDKQEKIVK